MRKSLMTAIMLVSLTPLAVQAAPPAEAPWVLVGLDIHMGAVTVRDTARDLDTVSVYGEGLPVYETKMACESALRRAIQKYAGRSHAEGNYGRYLCVDWRTFQTSSR